MSTDVANLAAEWSEAKLQSLPENGFTHEVVNGELIKSPKNNWFHGRICTRLIIALGNFAREHRLGAVLDSSTGFWMFNRNCRAPDVSFVPTRRLQVWGSSLRSDASFPERRISPSRFSRPTTPGPKLTRA